MSAWAQRRAATVQVVDLGGLTVGTWPGGAGGPAGPRVDPRFANSTVVDGSVVDGTVVDSTVVDSTVVDSTVVADTGTQEDRLPVRRPQ
jgi:hypothetical protein